MALVTPNPDCPFCHGAGHRIDVESDTKQSCVCVYWKRVGLRLGPEIATAKIVEQSPLYQPAVEHGGAPVIDKTKANLFLKGWWPAILSHFKWAFICKFNTVGLEGFSFTVVTDEKLRNVWFGKEAAQARSKKQRADEIETYNTVQDLIGPMHSLAIIRLGFLGWKNQAMGGILKEALMVRQALSLPTWLVEEPDSPFEEGHYTWSRDVGDYVSTRFEVLSINGGGPGREEEKGLSVDDETPEIPVHVDSTVTPPPQTKRSRPSEPAIALPGDDPVLFGGKRTKFNSKKRRQGGGPV